jgi:IPT/TIG domain
MAMNNKLSAFTAAGMIALSLVHGLNAHAQPPVLQRGYDPNVSGATLSETTLNTSNVSPSTFGLVFKLPVDDAIFAQPLYVPKVLVNQTAHNVLYVATMSDTLYAFDADVGGTPLWRLNLASLVGATPVPIAKFAFSGNRNIVGNLGILSTPVIDLSTNTMYVVACTLEGVTTSTPNGTMVYRLHAVDIATGATRPGSGVQISGSYGGSTFDGRYQTQRVSLALSGNQVVFGFAAVELEYAGGYVGWVMAYDKSTLAQSGVFATVTTGNRGGGVWQSGRPAVVDSTGFVYVFVGNAYGSGYDGVQNFSESVLKLDPANGLKLVDWFTPGNWSTLDTQDLDLTSSGPLLIPGTNLLAGGGKTGDLYVLNSANLGKFNAQDSQVVQKVHISASEFRGGPVYWKRSATNGGPLLYNWGVSDRLKAFPFNGTMFAATPSAQGSVTNQIFPGGILTLSANGEAPGSGVLWATTAGSGDAENNPPVPGVLYAFDAANVATELWNSTINATRDGFGNFGKFVPPLVANGRVYVATWSGQVAVYGLTVPPAVTGISPSSGTTDGGTSVTLTGKNFVAGATVSFGGAAAVVTSVNAATIVAKTPAHKPGSVTVVVKNPDGQSGTLSSGFIYRKHG